MAPTVCRRWVGPIWKLDGETCVCGLDAGHTAEHKCSCGSTFSDTGSHPAEVSSEGPS